MDLIGDTRLLQLLCGLWFVPHVIGKIRHFTKASETFEAAGFRPSRSFLVVTVAMEIAALLGLVLGIQVRLAALLGAAVLLGAAYAVLRINGLNWRWQKMGPEFPVFWALVCLVAGFGGAG